jgi:hypothetical protein
MLQVLVAISQKFVLEKKHGQCKSYSQKKEKEWVLRCLPEKMR